MCPFSRRCQMRSFKVKPEKPRKSGPIGSDGCLYGCGLYLRCVGDQGW